MKQLLSLFIPFFIMISCKTNRNEIYIPYTMSNKLDPLNIFYSGDWVVINHLWATLIDVRSDNTFSPILAKSWKSSLDGLTWEFELLPNLHWSDGTKMTADQIVSSLRNSLKGTSHTDLSKSIESISKRDSNIIRFSLKNRVPQFLLGLTYADWSILHPDTIKGSQTANIVLYSGAYVLKTGNKSDSLISFYSLTKNKYYPKHKEVSIQEGRIIRYQDCKELIKNSSHIASFRMYRDELSADCKKKLASDGFILEEDQPSWIIKADYTKRGLTNISLAQRLKLLKEIHTLLQKDYKKIGNIRATGLRASYLYGSLTESEFDNYLEIKSQPFLETKINSISIKLLAVDQWVKWKSYSWLIQKLKSLGVNLVVDIVTINDFNKKFNDDSIEAEYDLILLPLGVGDIDPDGTWRIASKYTYQGLITDNELNEAYLENDVNKREKLYKIFAYKLIESARSILLTMNSDIIGVHEDLQIKNGTALRNGTSLFDLE